MSNTLIKRRHPRYAVYGSQWEFFKGSYVGGEEYNQPNLFRYFKEGDDEFNDRVKRAYRENHTKRVVDLTNSYLFKEEATRESTNDALAKFWENFDGQGKAVADFMKSVSQWTSVMGRQFIVVDKKALPEDEMTGTQKDNLDPRAMPYCYMVDPQDVMDLSFDENGGIRWILIREQSRDDEDPFVSDGSVKDQFRLWEVGSWKLYNDKGDLIEEGSTGIDVVPVVIVDNEEQDLYTGQSLVGDVAYLDRAIFNNWSRLDVIVNDQTFSQLIFPIEGLAADIIDDKDARDQFMTLATNRILLYSASAQAAPTFISPDASQAEFILQMIQHQVKQLYASLGLQAEAGSEVKVQSGVAKAYDFDKLNKLLAVKADSLEHAEHKIVKIWAKWMGLPEADAAVDYPNEFDIKSLVDEVALAQELALLEVSETFMKEIKKAIALKALNRPKEETIRTIIDEIEADAEPEETAEKTSRFDFDEEEGEEEEA